MRLLLYSILPESGHSQTCGKGPFSALSRHFQIHWCSYLQLLPKVVSRRTGQLIRCKTSFPLATNQRGLGAPLRCLLTYWSLEAALVFDGCWVFVGRLAANAQRSTGHIGVERFTLALDGNRDALAWGT